MANTNTMSLAEYAAVRPIDSVTIPEVAEYLFNSFVSIFSPLYEEAACLADVHAGHKVRTVVHEDGTDEAVEVPLPKIDELTLAELSSIAHSMAADICPRLESACVYSKGDVLSFALGIAGSIDPEDKVAFLCAFALRNSRINACDINGTRINSKLPMTASFTFNIQHAVKVLNDSRGSKVGIGYRISLDNISIRTGMDVRAWNRLGQISSIQRGVGEAFGAQYQVYLFSKIRTFALGYPEIGFDMDAGLPSAPVQLVSTVSGWNVEEREGA